MVLYNLLRCLLVLSLPVSVLVLRAEVAIAQEADLTLRESYSHDIITSEAVDLATDLNLHEAVAPVVTNHFSATPSVEPLLDPKHEQQLLEALAVANSLDDPFGKATLLSDIARQYIELGQLNIAADILAQALETANSLNNVTEKMVVIDDIARQYLELDQPSQVQAIIASLDDVPAKIALTTILAQYYTETGQPSSATDALADSIALVETIDDASLRARLFTKIALEYSHIDKPESAERLLSQSRALIEQVARGFPFQPEPLSGKFGYGFSANFFDTSVIQASFDLQIKQQWPINDFVFLGNLSLNFDSDRSVNQLRPGGLTIGAYRHHFSPQVQYFANLLMQLNQGFISPSTEDEDTAFAGSSVMGGGYNLWRGKSPQQFLDLQVGVGVQYEYDEIVSEDVFLSEADPVLWLGLWAQSVPLGTTEIDQIIAFLPTLTDFNNFIIFSRTQFSIPLTERLSFVNTLQLRYRNVPVLEANPNWNILFSTGLGYDF